MKLANLIQEFSKAMKDDGDSDTSHFDAFTRKVIEECIEQVQAEYSITLPQLKIKVCNTKEFDLLLAGYPQSGSGSKPTAFIDHLKGLIAINVAALLELNPESFIANLVLNAVEELIHAAFPFDTESKVKRKTHQLTEKYLEYQIPADYKEASIRRSRRPGY